MTDQRQDAFEQRVAIDKRAIEIDHERHVFLRAGYCRCNGQGHFFLRMLETKMIHLKDSPGGRRQLRLPLVLNPFARTTACDEAASACASGASLPQTGWLSPGRFACLIRRTSCANLNVLRVQNSVINSARLAF